MITNTNMENLKKAMELTNKKFNGNITFNRLEVKSKNRIAFTLKVKNSSGQGAKIGTSGRKTIYACWHVHGYFMDMLFNLDSKSFVKSLGNTITKESGNWVDFNVGSISCPQYASELCNC